MTSSVPLVWKTIRDGGSPGLIELRVRALIIGAFGTTTGADY